MTRFSNILLVLSPDSENTAALRRAIALARKENAVLTVCEVVDSVPKHFRRSIVSVTPRELTDAIIAEKFSRIEKLIGSADPADVAVCVNVLVGKLDVEVARAVRENEHDLVILSIDGRYDLRSTTARRRDEKLIRSCPCPVWVVNSKDLNKHSRVLAALNMDPVNDELNENILKTAIAVALAEFRQLHIVHAWQLPGESHMRARGSAASIAEVDGMVNRESQRRKQWMRDTITAPRHNLDRAAIEFLSPEVHVVKGDPKEVVPELAGKLDAGLIVIGTLARSGLAGALLGNTSEKILSRTDSSLLIVKASHRKMGRRSVPHPGPPAFAEQSGRAYPLSRSSAGDAV
jgi:nucleotide-binding universal stress UspA family protein